MNLICYCWHYDVDGCYPWKVIVGDWIMSKDIPEGFMLDRPWLVVFVLCVLLLSLGQVAR